MIDKKTLQESLRRLRRIEGQIKGIQRMVEEERYCVEILNQLAAVQGALEQVGKVITKRHLESCVVEAFQSDHASERARKVEELMEVFFKIWRIGV